MTETILSIFSLYGAPALFAIIAIGQFGIPVPTSILLLTAGALQASGELSFWQLFAWGLAGAVTGDHIGYGAGRFAAVAIRARVERWPSVRGNLQKAEDFTRKWGDGGIFFSRWLVSPVGPYVNLTSGLTLYPLYRFTLADIAGEVVWIGGYLTLGNLFAQSISDIADIVANAAWMIAAAVVTVFLGWQIVLRVRRIRANGRKAG
ncbi:DedA family protein [Oricola sp.]|uniref:DedA family protein n=1 Tax=Oricola sp. TaxID=1979950 RepID=UPI0025FA2A3A|nr:DedA family protein [Oricola sp.]MCI5075419.1 DedA family protein [Oricola sp.]